MPRLEARSPLFWLVTLQFVCIVSAQHNGLMQALRNEAHKIATSTPIHSVCNPSPAPNSCLMRSLSGSGDFLHTTYDPNRIGEVSDLPPDHSVGVYLCPALSLPQPGHCQRQLRSSCRGLYSLSKSRLLLSTSQLLATRLRCPSTSVLRAA